jgi:hypothetical protein
MGRYFTFFQCAYEWSEPGQVLGFVDWLVTSLPRKNQLGLVVRKKPEAGEQEATASGDFNKLRGLLDQLSFESFRLGDRKWETAGTEIFFVFENVHYGFVVDDAKELRKIEVPRGMKILSLSVRLDVWQRCLTEGIAKALDERVEQLFSGLRCLYGYGTESALPITGRVCLISDGTAQKKLRIMDFDYSQFVEGVFQLNYLSNVHLQKTGPTTSLRQSTRDIECRDLRSRMDEKVGEAIYIKEWTSQAVELSSQFFRPLLFAPLSDER